MSGLKLGPSLSGGSGVPDGSITEAKLDAAAAAKLNQVGSASPSYKGDWQPLTTYAARDVVTSPEGLLVSRVTAGTSGAVFSDASWRRVAVSTARLPDLPVVSDENAIVTEGTGRSGTSTMTMSYQWQMPILSTAHGFRVLIGNFGAAQVDPITVECAALLDPTSDAPTRGLGPGGASSVTLQVGEVATFDFADGDLVLNQLLRVRTKVTVGALTQWSLAGPTRSTDLFQTGDHLMDATISGWTAQGGAPPGGLKPLAILAFDARGRTLKQPKSVACVGDSKTATRWPLTAFTGRAPMVNLGQSGARLYNQFAKGGSFRKFAVAQAQHVATATEAFGINDLLDSRTAAQLMQARVDLWRDLATQGPRVVATTCEPNTGTGVYTMPTSSGAGTDAAVGEAARTRMNDWMRDGAPMVAGQRVPAGTVAATRCMVVGPTSSSDETPVIRSLGFGDHPLFAVCDIADAVETARNSGAWKSGYSGDGIHPTIGAGTNPIAAQLPFALVLAGVDQRTAFGLDFLDDFTVAGSGPVAADGRKVSLGPWAAGAGMVVEDAASAYGATVLRKSTFSAGAAIAPIPALAVPNQVRVEATIRRTAGIYSNAQLYGGPGLLTTAANWNGYHVRRSFTGVSLWRGTAGTGVTTQLGSTATVAQPAGATESVTLDRLSNGDIVVSLDGVERIRVNDAAYPAGLLPAYIGSVPSGDTGSSFACDAFRARSV